MIRVFAICALFACGSAAIAESAVSSSSEEPETAAEPLPAPHSLPDSEETILPDYDVGTSCGCDDCGSCLFYAPSQPGPRIWGSAEYLLWWTRDMPVELPLIAGGDGFTGGVVGAPGTDVLVGNESIDFGTQHGGRFVIGGWLDACRKIGIEGNFFFLEEDSEIRAFNRTGADPGALFIPLFDTQFAQEGGYFSREYLLRKRQRHLSIATVGG